MFLTRECFPLRYPGVQNDCLRQHYSPRRNGMLPRMHAWSLRTDMDMEHGHGDTLRCSSSDALLRCHLFVKNLKSVRNPIARLWREHSPSVFLVLELICFLHGLEVEVCLLPAHSVLCCHETPCECRSLMVLCYAITTRSASSDINFAARTKPGRTCRSWFSSGPAAKMQNASLLSR